MEARGSLEACIRDWRGYGGARPGETSSKSRKAGSNSRGVGGRRSSRPYREDMRGTSSREAGAWRRDIMDWPGYGGVRTGGWSSNNRKAGGGEEGEAGAKLKPGNASPPRDRFACFRI